MSDISSSTIESAEEPKTIVIDQDGDLFLVVGTQSKTRLKVDSYML